VRLKFRSLVTAGAALAATAAMPAGVANASAPPGPYRLACPVSAPGHAQCLSLRLGNAPAATKVAPAQTPGAYGPSDLQSAYGLTSAAASKGSGETVAVVDAYDDPDAASDLAAYRSNYGLPSANLTIYNQNGGTTVTAPPAGSTGWDIEESLDLDMVSAICPNCSIDLVEADNNSWANLSTAANTAAGLPSVVAISNSYGGSEFSGETAYDSDYNHPGVAVTVAAGDNGWGVEFPAASQYVTAVGGTALRPDSSVTRGWTESVWGNGTEGVHGDGSGSGCSAYEPMASWQTSISDPLCSNRTVADVAANADPATGVVIYDTYNGFGGFQSGWGGTSEASPIIAAIYALAGVPASGTYPASYPYAHPGDLNDVTTGSNGDCGNYLCNGEPGYDGPTGLGTPEGTGAFRSAGTSGHTITVTNPGAQSSVQGTAITPLAIQATDSDASATLTYAATGLPAGLSIDSTTGVISGTPTGTGTSSVTVKATDGSGASGAAAFQWTVTASAQSPTGVIKATKLPPLVVEDRGGELANGNPVQVSDEYSAPRRDETWTLVSKGNYDLIELTKSPTHCLNVGGSGVANGSRVELWSCKAGDVDQEWLPLATGQLEAVYASSQRGVTVVLTDPNRGGVGTVLKITQYNGSKQQFWTLP
jgi:Putative Ig domain